MHSDSKQKYVSVQLQKDRHGPYGERFHRHRPLQNAETNTHGHPPRLRHHENSPVLHEESEIHAAKLAREVIENIGGFP